MPPVDWDQFRDASESKPLNPFYSTLEPFLPKTGRALDLGCGTGKGIVWLHAHGLSVVGVDNDPNSLTVCRQRVAGLAGVTVVESDFSEFTFGEYDVVLSVFSVFFVEPATFRELWPKVVSAIAPGGLFAGQLIGPNDDWVADGATPHDRREIEGLFAGFRFEALEEVERDGKTVWGEPKHWHVFHIVARRIE